MDQVEQQLFARGELGLPWQPAKDGDGKGRGPKAQTVKGNEENSQHNVSVQSAQPKSQGEKKVGAVDPAE